MRETDTVSAKEGTRPVRFALIGFGAWGSHHARAITECPEATLVAIAAHSSATQDEARQRYPDVAVYADHHELLAREDVEVVDVVLPTHLHHPFGLAVLSAGKHLLLEKPMALSEQHCNELMEAAIAAKRLLCVGHEFRLSSLWGRVKSMIDQGAIGEPQYALIELWRRPYRLGSGGWRYDIDRVGSWILEEPIHFFDLARWYFAAAGEPIRVAARAKARDPQHPELLDNFSAFLDFPGGAYAVISQTLSAFEHHQVVKVTGTKGALWATWSGAMDRTFHPEYSLKHYDGEAVHNIAIDRPTGEVYELVDQIAAMASAVRDDSPLHCTGHDGRWSVKMCLRAEESLATGLPVSLDAGLGGCP